MHKKGNETSANGGRGMAKKLAKTARDPLQPAQTREDWEAQGWASESVPVEATSKLEATISVRFDPESAALLRRAARLTGLTKSQFVRRATVQEAERIVDSIQLPISMWIPERRNDGVITRSSNAGERQDRTVTTTQMAVELVPH
jgi:hypothetical protein